MKSVGSQSSNNNYPDSKVHGANMGPIWGRQDPGGPHVGPMNFAIWVSCSDYLYGGHQGKTLSNGHQEPLLLSGINFKNNMDK